MTRQPLESTAGFRKAILDWYAANGRRLPFRATRDPWAILVSEAMAQQTQAERAGQAWSRFMDLFPTPAALAVATPADVLRAWQGLGYNRRALNLWRAARRIVDIHGGRVPADVAALGELPGVGPYTARAVAAIGFGIPVGAVDTNVRRVLGRILNGDARGTPAAALQDVADAIVPPDRPGPWTHALMDIGATICRPRQTDCGRCPARPWCAYAAESRDGNGSDAAARPVRASAVRPDPGIRKAPVAFVTTSRWLRGRIVDRLRTVDPGAWAEIDGPIGVHDPNAVVIALQGLARDGLIELDGVAGDGARRARLALS